MNVDCGGMKLETPPKWGESSSTLMGGLDTLGIKFHTFESSIKHKVWNLIPLGIKFHS